MSVKGFLDKYFKPEAPKVVPEIVLEPMVGTVPRAHLMRVQPEFVPSPPPSPSVSPASKPFHLFTDGACSENGKRGAKGGFGVHVYFNPSLDLSQPLLPTEPQTNNRAELRAIQAALDLIDRFGPEWSKDYTEFCVWSDSEYSINCLTKWAKGWRASNWKKRDGGLIQNLDLIKPLHERLTRMPRVSLRHVRGHQASTAFPYDGNHRADALATQSIR